MAAKSKTPAGKSQLPKELEALFAKGLEALSEGRGDEAAKTFADLGRKAAEAGNVGLERAAKGYADTARIRLAKAPKASGSEPTLDIQVLLNGNQAEEALEKAEKALKNHADQASLHYLRATALAQLGRFEDAAQALGKAIQINKDLLWTFFLEPDFSKARTHASFSVFESMV
ncbi:MAG: tetratricopeptide repeat protein [Acidobacteria bacterium]|nr:tetratricopeptide repeat protein [Acidobacteriota bacterium]